MWYHTIVVKTTVYLEDEHALALRQLSESLQRPQAELIRDAISEYTSRLARPKPKGVGRFRSGRNDLGERAEELLDQAALRREWD
jgi:hypothetical protein